MIDKQKINVLVSGSSHDSQAAYTALMFCQAAVAGGHEISQVFFYQAGTSVGNSLATLMGDEFDNTGHWVDFASSNQVALVCCVSAAERRGIISESQKSELGKEAHNMHPIFAVGGLGVFTDASLSSDRTVTFK
jgi:tRNA 2-thiouridine synthesizing protein D